LTTCSVKREKVPIPPGIAGTDKSDQSLKSELKYLKLIWFTG